LLETTEKTLALYKAPWKTIVGHNKARVLKFKKSARINIIATRTMKIGKADRDGG